MVNKYFNFSVQLLTSHIICLCNNLRATLDGHVLFAVAQRSERFATHRTAKGSDIKVTAKMVLEIVQLWESLGADFTL